MDRAAGDAVERFAVRTLDEARERLAAGGVVVVNVGHPEDSDHLERVLSATLRTEFPSVLRDPIRPTNTLLLATAAPGAGAQRLVDSSVPDELGGLTVAAAGRVRDAPRGGEVYTDDRAPVEWLIDASPLRYAAEGGR